MGEVEQLEARTAQNRRRITAQPDSRFAQSPQRFRVVVWKRRATNGRCRENVFGHSQGLELAESFGVLRERFGHHGDWAIPGEDDRSLRICASRVLALGDLDWRRERF